jgi:ABC-2 type transport system permease protein
LMSTVGRAAARSADGAVHRAARTAGFVWEHFKFNVASAMEYRWSFISQVSFMVLNDFLLLFFWWLIFGKVQTIDGWTFSDVITMHAVLATSYGLSVSVFGNVNRLARIIAEGQLDYYLLLPRNPLLHALVSRSDLSGLGDVAFGLAAFCLFTPVTPGRLALFVIVSLASCAVYTCFAVIAGSIAFFIGNAQTISLQLLGALITFGGYPGSIFKGLVRAVLYSVIPVGFVVYVPVSLLRSFSVAHFAGLLAFTAAIVWAASGLFGAGLRRYESGNLVSARI